MPLNTKLVVPVALGFSIVTVTAVVVYYILKKSEDSEDRAIRTSRINVIEVSVPKSIVPALIGRSSSNIKDIEKKSGALIHFKKFSDADYEVCIIRGRSEATQLAETLIHDFIKQQPLIEEEKISVPSWACGRIIGIGGENINDISHRSGARIKIENASTTDKSSERQINFRGTKEQIKLAKELIENCVSQEKCRREIEQSKRSPRHASHSQSSSPSPASEASEEPPGEPPTKHIKYKRPEGNGSSIEVYVSAVSSPSRFWVQFVGPQMAQLDELVSHMTDYYGKKENRTAHALQHVSVGQVVAAVFRHDGRWYRARVHDIRPNEFDATQTVADVFFVDYGDSEYVATHELCELRADLLRLRFQAMECFLAGVRPAGSEEEITAVTKSGQRWEKWSSQAIERFEDLTQVARWKALISRTCSYKKTATAEGEKEKEIPGIKLYDATEEGEVDIGATLIAEGLAVEGATRASPPPAPHTPFGDLGNSKVLSMSIGGNSRSSSVPKDHKDDRSSLDVNTHHDNTKENEVMTASKSLASGMEFTDKPLSISNFDLSYPDKSKTKLHNGSHENFLHAERENLDREVFDETLTPGSLDANSPILSKSSRDEFKANMNRIDSHHSNLDALGSHELHK